jgi:hypothetical protein
VGKTSIVIVYDPQLLFQVRHFHDQYISDR